MTTVTKATATKLASAEMARVEEKASAKEKSIDRPRRCSKVSALAEAILVESVRLGDDSGRFD
ncbi:hypothetical protein [Sorangium cellulosum]|uniref:hypothetical protein n=1 Tax=Sorangium cellulosum TaxID=56 RepID=UPI0010107035|nr:hypothetical protein [Sorangium cellulosum]